MAQNKEGILPRFIWLRKARTTAGIAHSLGKTEVWMSNLAWQPFFQERVDSILRERNRDALESMFKIQRFANPATSVELCDASFFLKARSRISLARTIRVFTTGFLGSEVTSLIARREVTPKGRSWRVASNL